MYIRFLCVYLYASPLTSVLIQLVLFFTVGIYVFAQQTDNVSINQRIMVVSIMIIISVTADYSKGYNGRTSV
jgi:hypothetical protein